ncbi:hypothetical protein FRC17_006096 [Serendipita sp. 399]|nr:hypothetical protein FRC17_006096 [Serendipita sp. 399]
MEGIHATKSVLRMLLAQLQVVEAFEVPQPACIISEAISSSLSATEQRIVDLTQQLRSEIDVYMQAITSIHAVHAIAPPAQETGRFKTKLQALSPISRCPDVLLEEIFKLVAENGSHAMLPLLTVNKQFYRVVMSNPVLWRKIFIEIDGNIQEINSLSDAYVDICVGRSRDVLLDVILDCRRIPNPPAFMWHYICNIIRQSEEDKLDVEVATDYLFDQLQAREMDEAHEYWEFPLYERRLDLVLDMTKSLLGAEGANACRWRTATIKLPDRYCVTEALWPLISTAMPNLRSLRLNNIDYSALRKMLLGHRQPVLTHFEVSNPVDLSQVSIDFGFLTTLDFVYCSNQGTMNLVTLSQCVALRELNITCRGRDSDDVDQANVELPTLVSLQFRQSVSILRRVRFHLPKLENWYLDCRPTKNLPHINAPYIRWNVLLYPYQNEMEWFVRCLLKLTTATKLVLDGIRHPEACFAEIRKMKNTLPRSLKVVEIVDAGSLDLTTDD